MEVRESGIKLCHGNIILEEMILENAELTISDGRITSIHENSNKNNSENGDYTEIDLQDHYIAPGFIDIHCHGGAGYDFMDGTPEAFHEISKFYAQEGVTSLVATSMTAESCEIYRFIKAYGEIKSKLVDGAEILGLHLEGPYLSDEMSGAQDCTYLKKIKESDYTDMLNMSKDILRMSVAPELPGAEKLIKELRQRNIVASIAHTTADFDIFNRAVSWGCSHVTHLYSGMKGIFYENGLRKAGAVEAALLNDNVTVELIADGRHLPSAIIELVYKIKGPGRISIVSDAMRATGTKRNESILGSVQKGSKVIIEGGVAKRLDKKSLAGSITPLNRMVKYLYENTSIPLLDIVKMVSATPSDIMRLNGRGRIRKCSRADITVLDKDLNVSMVIIGGKIAKNIL